MFEFITALGLAGFFLLALPLCAILCRLALFPMYRLTGGRLSFCRWWKAMGPL